MLVLAAAKRQRALLVVLLLVLAYALLFTTLAMAQHAAHQTSVFDLGVYDQVIWNTSQGRILAYSAEPEFGSNFLATHLQPILILFAPVYWLWDDVRALFMLQTLAIALGALPVFWIARRKTGSELAAVIACAAYLLLPSVEAANLFDFHPETFTPVLCLSLVVCLEQIDSKARAEVEPGARTARRWYWLFWMLVILVLAVKEDLALTLAALGLYTALWRRRPRLGATLMGVAATWFVVGVYVVMPYFHHGQLSPFLTFYATLGDSPQSIIWNALTRPAVTASLLFTPENAVALLALLLPLAGLPLLGLPVFLVAVPAMLLNGLSDNPLMHLMEDKHYATAIVPFALLAAIDGLLRLKVIAGRLKVSPAIAIRVGAVVLLGASLGYHYFRGYTPLSRLFTMPEATAHDILAAMVEAQIPAGASLVAQDRLYPQLSHREQIHYQWTADTGADYILLDVAQSQFLNVNDLHGWLRQQITDRTDYGVVSSRDGYIVLQRGAPHAGLAPEFYSFAQVQQPQIIHPLRAQFGGELELLGWNYVARRDQELMFELFWQPMRPGIPDRLPNLYLLDTSGKSIAETRFAQPTLVWYPTSQWRPDAVTRLLVNTVTWTTEGMDRYTIGLSVLDQPDPLKAKRALPVSVDGDNTGRVLPNGTMLRLGDFQKQFGLTWLAR